MQADKTENIHILSPLYLVILLVLLLLWTLLRFILFCSWQIKHWDWKEQKWTQNEQKQVKVKYVVAWGTWCHDMKRVWRIGREEYAVAY